MVRSTPPIQIGEISGSCDDRLVGRSEKFALRVSSSDAAITMAYRFRLPLPRIIIRTTFDLNRLVAFDRAGIGTELGHPSTDTSSGLWMSFSVVTISPTRSDSRSAVVIRVLASVATISTSDRPADCSLSESTLRWVTRAHS